jgi:membrane protein required for colicin V production
VGGSNRFLPYFAFAIIFFPIILLVNKLGSLLRKSLQYSLLGSFDSMAGAIMGIFTWAFGISVFLWLIAAIGVLIPQMPPQIPFFIRLYNPLLPNVISKASAFFPKREKIS